MASGNQTWKGNWADLPIAPRNSRMAAVVTIPWLISPPWAAAKAADILKLSTSRHSNRIPTRRPTSPIRVTMKAFLAASLAAGRSCQKSMSR